MRAIIAQKRDGNTLSTAQIEQFVQGYTAGTIPDYQASALLVAIYLNGMTRKETADLTLAMAQSGTMLDLSDIAPFVVDKHSSGGVGDKTTLVVAPLVAACGVPVGKMSGRGLGVTGGTLDKMEAIPGWRSDLTIDQFREQLEKIQFVLAGQSVDLAPADGKMYALRDVTATVGSVPLIAASIMSKKLASGANGIVLDVKVGAGTSLKTVDEARELAQVMVDIGRDSGRRTVAILTNMNQPLGHTIGNRLEVKEALDTLTDNYNVADDFWMHCVLIASWMLVIAGKAQSLEAAEELIFKARKTGAGYAKFLEMVHSQGGRTVDALHRLTWNYAAHIKPIYAPTTGYVKAIDAGKVGWAAVQLGGGRQLKTDEIDHAVGFVLTAKVGDYIVAQQEIGEVHANRIEDIEKGRHAILEAIQWSDSAVDPAPHVLGIIE